MSNWNGTAYHLSEADVSSAFNAICSSELVQLRKEHCARLTLETRVEIRDGQSVNAFASRMSDAEIKKQIANAEINSPVLMKFQRLSLWLCWLRLSLRCDIGFTYDFLIVFRFELTVSD